MTHFIKYFTKLQLLKQWNSVHIENNEKKIQMLRNRTQIHMET